MSLPTLKKVALTNFIRSSANTGKIIDPFVSTINEDLISINSFLSYYGMALQNTGSLGSVSPFENGLDGSNLFVDKLIVSGRYWNASEGRPKSLRELFDELYISLDAGLAVNSVSAEFAGVKNKIGQNRFDRSVISADGSVDSDLAIIKSTINQLIADIFNVDKPLFSAPDTARYSIIGRGNQTQVQTISDKLNKLIDLHGNAAHLSHDSLKQDVLWTSAISINKLVEPGSSVVTAPFYSSIEVDDIDGPVFHSPYDKPLEVKKLSVAIGSNDVQTLSVISLEIDDTLIDFSVGISGNVEHKIIHAEPSAIININPNSRIRFIIDTGSQGTNGLVIHNISLLLKDK